MKLTKYIIIAISAVSFLSACSDESLTLKNPNQESSDTFWSQEEDFRKGLSATYSVFRIPHFFSRFYHVWHTLRSDEGYSTSPAPEWHAYGNFQYTPYNTDSTEGIVNPWIAIYRQLFYVNQVIDNMNERGYTIFANNDNTTEADQILGQAYFLRATAYWYLATTYGKGPRQISSTEYGEVIEQLEIYKQSLSDYEMAESLLPTSWSGSEEGRVTKGGAMGMQARVHMQLAGYYKRPKVANQQEAMAHWTAAKEKIEDIYELKIYSLMPNWVDNFTDKNENNVESLVEIQFKEGLVNGKEVGMHRPKFFGLFLSTGDGAWDDASPNPWLLTQFDKESNNDGEPDIRKYYTLFYDNPTDTMTYYGKTYAEWRADGELPKTCYWRKYSSVDSTPGKSEDYSSGVNYRLLRLADIYLMYAEVINELDGDRSVAVEYINKVRRRVNMGDLNSASYANYDALLTQIKHERLMELCGENVRWLDLDRWGEIHTQEGINLLSERDDDFSTYRLDISHLICIPNRELALYPGLTQNPGY